MTNTFSDLHLPPKLVSALESLAITEPTAIQTAAIPLLLEKKDLYLQAETGTGKTLAYLLPLFATIDCKIPNAQAIIAAPTYELAIQIQRLCVELAQKSGIPVQTILLIGGTSPVRQLEKLKKKPHLVVGSLGRIREFIETKKLKTHLVQTIVIDEADRLLANESLGDLQAITKSTRTERNLVFVSATEQPATAKAIASLSSKVSVIKTAAAPVNPNIKHYYLVCAERDKAELTRKVIHAMQAPRTIVFLHKNEDAEIVASKLDFHKMRVIDIHAALDKGERKFAMDMIRSGKADIMIASDVAARGLDIKGLTHVINFDLPSSSEAYLHRVGRTGRAGAEGIAVSLFSTQQLYLVDRYKKDLGISLQEIYLREGQVHTAEHERTGAK